MCFPGPDTQSPRRGLSPPTNPLISWCQFKRGPGGSLMTPDFVLSLAATLCIARGEWALENVHARHACMGWHPWRSPQGQPTVAARHKARPWVSGSCLKRWGGRRCCLGGVMRVSECEKLEPPVCSSTATRRPDACIPTWQTRCICYVASLWGGARLHAAPGGRGGGVASAMRGRTQGAQHTPPQHAARAHTNHMIYV